ncbi:MAG: putative toxin-antitoxin system toxin component, PIN family [Nevskiales bacterium]
MDTNVLVSALLSPQGVPAQVLQLILAGKTLICHDVRILDEYRRVLRRPKFPFDSRDVDDLVNYLESSGEAVACVPLPDPLPDPDDGAFLEAALAGHADYLVTGNLKHYPAKLRRGVAVVTPAEFLKEVLRKWPAS